MYDYHFTSADGQPQTEPTGMSMWDLRDFRQCGICGKEEADWLALYRHRKMHDGEKMHPCPYCERKFISRYIMKMHIKGQHKKAHMEAQAKEAENQAGLPSMDAEPAPETPPPEVEKSH